MGNSNGQVTLPGMYSRLSFLSGLTDLRQRVAKVKHTADITPNNNSSPQMFVKRDLYLDKKGNVLFEARSTYGSDRKEIIISGAKIHHTLIDENGDGNFEFMSRHITDPDGKQAIIHWRSTQDNGVYDVKEIHDEAEPGQHFDSDGYMMYNTYVNKKGF
jgi:hypothetical protein